MLRQGEGWVGVEEGMEGYMVMETNKIIFFFSIRPHVKREHGKGP